MVTSRIDANDCNVGGFSSMKIVSLHQLIILIYSLPLIDVEFPCQLLF